MQLDAQAVAADATGLHRRAPAGARAEGFGERAQALVQPLRIHLRIAGLEPQAPAQLGAHRAHAEQLRRVVHGGVGRELRHQIEQRALEAHQPLERKIGRTGDALAHQRGQAEIVDEDAELLESAQDAKAVAVVDAGGELQVIGAQPLGRLAAIERGGHLLVALAVLVPKSGGADAYERLLELRHPQARGKDADRKSTRLNSSHVKISYAVFCLNKKISYAVFCLKKKKT